MYKLRRQSIRVDHSSGLSMSALKTKAFISFFPEKIFTDNTVIHSFSHESFAIFAC